MSAGAVRAGRAFVEIFGVNTGLKSSLKDSEKSVGSFVQNTNSTMKLLRGGGAMIGLTFALRSVSEALDKMEGTYDQLASGALTAAEANEELALSFVKMVPIIGNAFEVGQKIGDFLSGDMAAAAREKAAEAAGRSAHDRQVKEIEDLNKLRDERRKIMDDFNADERYGSMTSPEQKQAAMEMDKLGEKLKKLYALRNQFEAVASSPSSTKTTANEARAQLSYLAQAIPQVEAAMKRLGGKDIFEEWNKAQAEAVRGLEIEGIKNSTERQVAAIRERYSRIIEEAKSAGKDIKAIEEQQTLELFNLRQTMTERLKDDIEGLTIDLEFDGLERELQKIERERKKALEDAVAAQAPIAIVNEKFDLLRQQAERQSRGAATETAGIFNIEALQSLQRGRQPELKTIEETTKDMADDVAQMNQNLQGAMAFA